MLAASANSSAYAALLWSFVLVLGIVALGVMILALRRWLFTPKFQPDQSMFSLQHLRELRAEGQITEEEFQKLKAQAIADMADSRKNGAPGDAPRSFDPPRKQIKQSSGRRR